MRVPLEHAFIINSLFQHTEDEKRIEEKMEETIAAVLQVHLSGIGIVRISGKDAWESREGDSQLERNKASAPPDVFRQNPDFHRRNH